MLLVWLLGYKGGKIAKMVETPPQNLTEFHYTQEKGGEKKCRRTWWIFSSR